MIKIILIFIFLVGVMYAENITKNFVIKPRIINGTQVSQNDNTWRFIVALKYNGSQYCGGSLIAPNWVLTAAHCLSNEYTGEPYVATISDTVGAGSYHLGSTINYEIKRFIIHPAYNFNTLDNDIALIELDTNVTAINPILYDTAYALSVDTQTKVAGWGNMSTNSENYPKNLREALTPILDFNQCNSSSSYEGELTKNMLCAGYFVSNRDSCQGDSGGPLIVDNTLVGIVSWGNEKCATDGYPGIYTKVQNYTNWIKSYVPKKVNISWVPIMVGNIIIFVPK